MTHHAYALLVAAGATVLLLAGPALAADRASWIADAVACRPHPRQVAWQQGEFSCFIHFGPNTFTDRAWGSGKEDPNVFNPTQLDCEQWVLIAKSAGMTMITLTVKHHDGFCLWPSRYTAHNVAASKWRGGKGDVLADLAAACRKHGLKLGVYLSPADIVEAIRDGGRYGNASAVRKQTIPLPAEGRPFRDARTFEYDVDDYNAYFISQLFELLTEYGPVHQVWLDGARPPDAARRNQPYQVATWYDIIHKLAPMAVISIHGPDTRWCGNEGGRTRAAEWSVIPLPKGVTWPNEEAFHNRQTRDNFPTPDMFDNCGRFVWYPAETNTTIRPGWFYSSKLKPRFNVANLLDIYYRSVGGNSLFLLNLSPDTRGLIPEADVAMMKQLGGILRATFDTDLAEDAVATASSIRGGDWDRWHPQYVRDKSMDTYWMTDDGVEQAELVFTLPRARTFNRAVVQESISRQGQRIESCALDAWQDGKWKQVAEAKTVGYKRIMRFDDVTADKVRLRITASRICPTVSWFSLHYQPPLEPAQKP